MSRVTETTHLVEEERGIEMNRLSIPENKNEDSSDSDNKEK